ADVYLRPEAREAGREIAARVDARRCDLRAVEGVGRELSLLADRRGRQDGRESTRELHCASRVAGGDDAGDAEILGVLDLHRDEIRGLVAAQAEVDDIDLLIDAVIDRA